jgi:hypothetical protein
MDTSAAVTSRYSPGESYWTEKPVDDVRKLGHWKRGREGGKRGGHQPHICSLVGMPLGNLIRPKLTLLFSIVIIQTYLMFDI